MTTIWCAVRRTRELPFCRFYWDNLATSLSVYGRETKHYYDTNEFLRLFAWVLRLGIGIDLRIGLRADLLRFPPISAFHTSGVDRDGQRAGAPANLYQRKEVTMTRVGILGYGNLGKGVELAIRQNDDMELVGVFTRRDPATVTIATPDVLVRSASELDEGAATDVDVLIICGGSATDLPKQTPKYAAKYNVVDSFDTHAHIPEHFANVDAAAKAAGKTALISCGWDPGLFSLNRLYANCILPQGNDYTFWGRGVSQGHSDALRRIPGVADAKQYTNPVPEALEAVRAGENPELTTREKHTRECWVVLEEGADPAAVTEAIVNMPDYFDEYDVDVNFISQEELDRDHAGLPHGGFVIRSGQTAGGKNCTIEYSLKLESNPEFTACVLVAYARAVARLAAEGSTGCKTVFDIAPAYLSASDGADLRAHLL